MLSPDLGPVTLLARTGTAAARELPTLTIAKVAPTSFSELSARLCVAVADEMVR